MGLVNIKTLRRVGCGIKDVVKIGVIKNKAVYL